MTGKTALITRQSRVICFLGRWSAISRNKQKCLHLSYKSHSGTVQSVGVSLISLWISVSLKPISELLHEFLHLPATEAQACSAKGEDDIHGSFVLTPDALFLAHWDAACFSKWFSALFWSTAASCALQTGKVTPISCSIYDLSNKNMMADKKECLSQSQTAKFPLSSTKPNINSSINTSSLVKI